MRKKKNEDEIQTLLNRKCDELSSMIFQIEKSLRNVPVGRLRMCRNGGKMQCFQVTEETSSHGVYIPVSKIKLSKALAQKDYNQKILRELQIQLKTIQTFIDGYSPNRIDSVFAEMHQARRALVNPVRLLDETYIDQWNHEKYVGQFFDENDSVVLTSRGEQVRSKSEVIIADSLYRMGVPYKYECPVNISVKKGAVIKIYPDFTCLNVRLRKEIIWEHFGRMGDGAYAANVAKKMDGYFANGFIPGDNMIFSMESNDCVFDAKKAELIIEKFLL